MEPVDSEKEEKEDMDPRYPRRERLNDERVNLNPPGLDDPPDLTCPSDLPTDNKQARRHKDRERGESEADRWTNRKAESTKRCGHKARTGRRLSGPPVR